MKKKKIIISSVIGLILLVSTIGALNPTETPQQPKHPETTQIPSSDPDEPTVLVKDPETGETKAVSPNEIKNNPQLAQQVIHNPTSQDFQQAGISSPKYNCIKEIYEVDGTSQLTADLGGGNDMSVSADKCKTIKSKVYPKPDGPPVFVPDTEPVYVSSSYMKDYAEFTGNCVGSGRKLSATFTALVRMSDEPVASRVIIEDQRPSLSFDSRCEKWVLRNSTSPKRIDFGYSSEPDETGNLVYLGGGYRQTFYYDKWQFTKETYPIQRRVAVCTVNGTAHYKEIATGDPCDLYKSNHNGWSTNKL